MRNKKVIALAALSSVFTTSVLTGVGQSASASIVGRVGSAMRNSMRSVNSAISRSSSLRSVGSRASRVQSISGSISGVVQGGASGSGGGSRNGSIVGGSLSNINQRLQELEQARSLEQQKNASPLSKAILASGLIGSAAMVAGVVGGIVQQRKMMGLSSEQSKADQQAQKDLNEKKQILQEKEIPEAVQEIIDYYRDHYGIQLTTKDN